MSPLVKSTWYANVQFTGTAPSSLQPRYNLLKSSFIQHHTKFKSPVEFIVVVAVEMSQSVERANLVT